MGHIDIWHSILVYSLVFLETMGLLLYKRAVSRPFASPVFRARIRVAPSGLVESDLVGLRIVDKLSIISSRSRGLFGESGCCRSACSYSRPIVVTHGTPAHARDPWPILAG